ncbi:MAG: hypothetical protein ABIK37_01090, partial [candidate division WOR-3 bacterium]
MKSFWPQTAAEWVVLVSGVIGVPVGLALSLGVLRTEPAVRLVILCVCAALLVLATVVIVRKAVIARRLRGKVIVLLTEFHDPRGQGITD